MKKGKLAICIFLAVLLLLFPLDWKTVQAEGLLPSLSETVGISMPSLGEALGRYSEKLIENKDGSVTELYSDVSESDFDTFSVYLQEKGAVLADYQVNGSALKAEIQIHGASFVFSYNIRKREAAADYPAGTYDEWEKSAKTHFAAANRFFKEKNYKEAIDEIYAISLYENYGSATKLLEDAIRNLWYYNLKMGDTVKFGRYEQDNNVDNGMEPIEWLVLEVQEEKCLLLSKYGLDARAYNNILTDISWENCTIRKWLNEEFLDQAFTKEEQAAILSTIVENGKKQGNIKWNTDGGNDTQDRIFLLSWKEKKQYLGAVDVEKNIVESKAYLTNYAVERGAQFFKTNNKETDMVSGPWWLRSPGYYQRNAAFVNNDGYIASISAKNVSICVRPALWMDLKSGTLLMNP